MLSFNTSQIICILSLILTTTVTSNHAKKRVKHHGGRGKHSPLTYEDVEESDLKSNFLHLIPELSKSKLFEDTTVSYEPSRRRSTEHSRLGLSVDKQSKRYPHEGEGKRNDEPLGASRSLLSELDETDFTVGSQPLEGIQQQQQQLSHSFPVYGGLQMWPTMLPYTPPHQPYGNSPMTSDYDNRWRHAPSEGYQPGVSSAVISTPSPAEPGIGFYNSGGTQQQYQESYHAQHTNAAESSNQFFRGPYTYSYQNTYSVQAEPSISTMSSSVQHVEEPKTIPSSFNDLKRGLFQASNNIQSMQSSNPSGDSTSVASLLSETRTRSYQPSQQGTVIMDNPGESSRNFNMAPSIVSDPMRNQTSSRPEEITAPANPNVTESPPSILSNPMENTSQNFATGEMKTSTTSDQMQFASETSSGAPELGALNAATHPLLWGTLPFGYYGLNPWSSWYGIIPGGWGGLGINSLPLVPMGGHAPKFTTVVKANRNLDGFANGMGFGTGGMAMNFMYPLDSFVYEQSPLIPFTNTAVLPSLGFGLGSGPTNAFFYGQGWDQDNFKSVLRGGGEGLWVPLLNHQQFIQPTLSWSDAGVSSTAYDGPEIEVPAIETESVHQTGSLAESQADERESHYRPGIAQKNPASGSSVSDLIPQNFIDPHQFMMHTTPKPSFQPIQSSRSVPQDVPTVGASQNAMEDQESNGSGTIRANTVSTSSDSILRRVESSSRFVINEVPKPSFIVATRSLELQ